MQLSIPKNKSNISKVLLIIILIFTLGLYLITPMKEKVSMPFFYLCFCVMLLSNYIYFRAKRKLNYLDFDTIFIVIYCLVGFSTTFFYNNYDVFRAIFLGFPVDEEYINKGNILFLIGLQSYMIGSVVNIRIKKSVSIPYIIKTNFLITIVFILIFAFFVFGGVNYYRSEYNNSVKAEGGSIVKYILLLLVTASMALIGTEFYNKRINSNYKISWFAFASMLLLILTLLFIGNRTAASQILLPIICLYALFFKKVTFKKFILFVMLGIPFMWFFQQIRTGKGTFELTNPIMIILDLTIPMRNTYSSLQYVDTKEFTYGSSMAIDVSGVVPFLPSLVQESFPDLKQGSAALLTDYTYINFYMPVEYKIGLGTTIIADIYIAFGLAGVFLMMFGLGYCVNRWSTLSYFLDYYSIIILCGFLGNAIFMVRAGYFHPLRFIIWALILASINKFLHRAWKK